MDSKHIAIPVILKIGPGVLDNLGSYLMDVQLQKVVILFGNGLIDMFGMDVMESLKESGVEVLEYQELDTVRLEDLTSLAFSMPAKTQAIIGIGGGKVIDAAKYCGFLRNLAFISIPTSASSDGFSSASAPEAMHLRWIFQCECIASGGGTQKVRSGAAGVWYRGRHEDHQECTEEILIFRYR